MLLSNRRVAFLHLLLAGMQAVWIAPFVLLAWRNPGLTWTGFAAVLAGLLAWMLALELLSRAVEAPLYDTLALGMLVVVSLVLVRLVLYAGGQPWDLSWIGRAVRDTANWKGGLPPALVLIVANLLLWQRASSATSRDLNFFGVGVSFRSGLLLLVLGGALLGGLIGTAPLGLLWLYLALGLSAVAISRISEKAAEAQSIGRMLPASRLIQTLSAIGVAVAASWLFSLAYSDQGLRGFFRLFDPLWQLVRPLLLQLLVALARLLNPLLLGFEAFLTRLLNRPDAAGSETAPPVSGGELGPNPFENLPRWPFDLARDVMIVIVVGVAALGLVIFLLLYLERVRKTGLQDEDEEEGRNPASFGGGIVDRALGSLRNAAGLIQRFGISRELLAAISVQNIYANLCRLARQRGKPRLASQPPDAYLPVLAQAFPGEEERLRHITSAYMRVHYGDHPVGSEELAALREDYRVLLEARPTG